MRPYVKLLLPLVIITTNKKPRWLACYRPSRELEDNTPIQLTGSAPVSGRSAMHKTVKLHLPDDLLTLTNDLRGAT